MSREQDEQTAAAVRGDENERIAVELMGWEYLEEPQSATKRIVNGYSTRVYHWRHADTNSYEDQPPDYAADWNAAALVVQALEGRGWHVSHLGWVPSLLVTVRDDVLTPPFWCCTLAERWDTEPMRFGTVQGLGETLPLAVCAAAIEVLDREAGR